MMPLHLVMCCRRMKDAILRLPYRVFRLLRWICWIDMPDGRHRILRWCVGIILLFVDCIPVAPFLEWVADIIRPSVRALNQREKALLQSVFGNAIPLTRIGITTKSRLAERKRIKAFVALHTIHSSGELPDQTLIHEAVHIWQYHVYGSVYISEAIWAQHWGGGYNYGGGEQLELHANGKGLRAFNFEQQADIIEDYFRMKSDLSLQWSQKDQHTSSLLTRYAADLFT